MAIALLANPLFAAERARLVVEPPEISLVGPADAAQCLATLELAGGVRQDVTHRAVWKSDNEQVSRVEKGRIKPVGNGNCSIDLVLPDAPGGSLSTKVTVKVAGHEIKPELNFRRDIEPILTKYGCNAGGCHGKMAGQKGFKLSLFGFDPKGDYDSLVNDGRGRRISFSSPDQSLLLLKPSCAVPHGGGKVLDANTEPYLTLRRWIDQRLPWGNADLSDFVRIEAFPRQQIVDRGERQQLRVLLHHTDGKVRDITAEAEYRSQRPEFLDVDRNGLVTFRNLAGEGTVFVRFLGMVDIVRFSIPFSREVADDAYRHFLPINVVDQHVLAKWRALGIVPSAICSDQEFIRRIYLDCIGRLPEPQEIRDFLADTTSDKRSRLIDRLFSRPEFADFWTMQLGDVLQIRRERDKNVWGPKGVRAFHQWLRQQVATNQPWNEIAHDVLTVIGNTSANPAIGYFIVCMGSDGDVEQTELVQSVAQSFLGTRLGCAKCHNHPSEKYTQDDFYHFAAFFSRVRMKRVDADKGVTELYLKPPDSDQPSGVRQPRTGAWLPPRTLDGKLIPVEKNEDGRHKFVGWATDKGNENFSGAMVNRLVKHFLGVGLVEPVDDLRATNPPTNAELWQALNKEFVDHNFDLRHIMRLLLQSRTYQLSSSTRPENVADWQYYSHFYVRRLSAEVLLDAIGQATGAPTKFAGYPVGIRAVQLPDVDVNSYFLTAFGRSARTTACACEREGAVTLPQLLHLQNGDRIVDSLHDPNGRLARLRTAPGERKAILEELYLSCLSRLPDATELAAVEAEFGATSESRNEALADLVWALLNTKEFCFNH